METIKTQTYALLLLATLFLAAFFYDDIITQELIAPICIIAVSYIFRLTPQSKSENNEL